MIWRISCQELLGHPCVLFRAFRPEVLAVLLIMLEHLSGTHKTISPSHSQKIVFQAKFHWHVEDKGIRHVYIKPRSPQLNGKVERSHRTDQEEFYPLLNYIDDVDLNKKLAESVTYAG